MVELYNMLTETKMKFKIPVTEGPTYKIRGLIAHEILFPTTNENQANRFSDDEIIDRTEKCLKKLAEDEEFSGAVMVAKNGKALLKNAIGQASKEYDIPNATDTKFNMASVGKMFTGLAIAKLVEQGKLSFDDPISKYVQEDWLNPEISKKIQIRHLLTHTSGLGDYFKNAYAQCAIPFFRDLEDYKSLVVHDTLNFDPGTKFSYSNTGMLLLGVIIENVTGTDYFTYLKNTIFEPAGMVNSDGFDKSVPVKNRATGYSKEYLNGEVTWNNHQFTRVMRGSPSGGVYSTVEDLLKFDMAIRSNTLLSPPYTKMLLEGRPELNASFHSYAFFVSEGYWGRQISHGGDGQGVNCQFKMYYDLGYTFAVLSNFSQPSANIVANVLDQLISNESAISQ
jgi:CubicO group peptidase (beta-lactamase class C family)